MDNVVGFFLAVFLDGKRFVVQVRVLLGGSRSKLKRQGIQTILQGVQFGVRAYLKFGCTYP